MEILKAGQIIKVGNSLALIIPVDICRALKIERGDRFVFGIYGEDSLAARRITQQDLINLKPTHESITY